MNGSTSGRVYFEVFDYIKRLVREGKVHFGEKLPSEREMMETLRMSRNSIREALRTLEHMGLVESRQGKGNFLVNHMGKSFTSVFSMLLLTGESSYLEISELRRCLETEALYLLHDRISKERIQELREIVGHMKTASAQERTKLDAKFHSILVESSGNVLFCVLGQAMEELYAAEISLAQDTMDSEELSRLAEVHGRILESIRSGDMNDGIRAIQEHYDMIDCKIQSDGKEKTSGER